ncbi:MAG TPA: SRPBCC family protein, partial [Longimicrobiales bacterium]|nr:SRPBCC family protein [Longimicrobiales bacterium]
MSAMKGFISVLAIILLSFVVIGLLLPGSWHAERTRLVAAPVEEVFPYLEDLTLWQEWSSMGQVEGTLSDPPRGPGSTLTWDDPQWGAGEFRLTGVTPLREVRYEVAVED